MYIFVLLFLSPLTMSFNSLQLRNCVFHSRFKHLLSAEINNENDDSMAEIVYFVCVFSEREKTLILNLI